MTSERFQDGDGGEQLAHAGCVHHHLWTHGTARWVAVFACLTAGKDLRAAYQDDIADHVALELAVQALAQLDRRDAGAVVTDPIGRLLIGIGGTGCSQHQHKRQDHIAAMASLGLALVPATDFLASWLCGCHDLAGRTSVLVVRLRSVLPPPGHRSHAPGA
jgi:hypothetical protein